VTPEGIEVPRCTMDPDCAATVSQQPLEHRATLPTGPDPKWRYFWRLGSRNEGTAYEELNTEPNVLPAGALSGRSPSAASLGVPYWQASALFGGGLKQGVAQSRACRNANLFMWLKQRLQHLALKIPHKYSKLW
jgi:hypothetical protein